MTLGEIEVLSLGFNLMNFLPLGLYTSKGTEYRFSLPALERKCLVLEFIFKNFIHYFFSKSPFGVPDPSRSISCVLYTINAFYSCSSSTPCTSNTSSIIL